MSNSDDFFVRQRQHLLARRESKKNILERGGEQSFSHSWNDITRIDFALRRIDQGQYGLCCNCGCPIDHARLLLIPETPFCAPCATHVAAQ